MMPVSRLARFATAIVAAGAILAFPGAAPAQVSGADISVTKSDSPDPVAVGADLTYTITVRNDGPLDAPGVVVTDALILTVDFVSATPSQGSCSEVALVVTCNLGTVANGATATVTLVVKPEAQGSLLNGVSAVPTPSSLDQEPQDNVAVESTTVTGSGGGPGADLVVSKADAPDPIAPGGTLNYTVTVQNLGSEAASGVQVVDVLPLTGATYGSVSSSQGTCGNPVALLLTCDIGGLANGASATVQIAIQPTQNGTLVNTATALATTFDPAPGNNVAAASTTVDPDATTPGGGGGGGGKGGGAGQGLAACTIMGTPLADILKGTAGNDVICGLDGNDKLTGLAGNDALIGGKDNDRGNGGKGRDVLKGQSGKDRLQGAAKSDRLSGGGSADRLAGGPGKDRVNGGGGKDRCQRGKGDKLTKCP